jgi:uncharacterized membrane protein (DUF106 family)
MTGIFNQAIVGLFHLLFIPFRDLNPWVAMIAVSLLTSLFMLLVFRYTSDQKEIRLVQDQLKACLFEMLLFKDDLRVTLGAQRKFIWNNLRYLRCTLKPMMVMSLPMAFMLIHLDLWFGYRALNPGEDAILKVQLADGQLPSRLQLSLHPSPGVQIETPPLRIDSAREVDWRLRARNRGLHKVTVKIGAETIAKEVVVGGRELAMISRAKVRGGWFSELLHPGEPALPGSSAVSKIEVSYPVNSRSFFLGWGPHWLLMYLSLSMLFSFIMKAVFHIEG